MRRIGFFVCVLVAVYGFALQFGMFNQHFDRAPPRMVEGVVFHIGMRFNPLPIHVIDAKTADGRSISIDVLEETASSLHEGEIINFAEKPGFLGKQWYEEAAFYKSLENSRTFQGVVALAIFGIVIGVWARSVSKSKEKANGYATIAGAVLVGFVLSYVL